MSDGTRDPELYFDCHVFVCTNERAEGHTRGSCARRGSLELRDYMKKRVKALGLPNTRVNAAGCLDRCELGVTMVIYPAGVWYSVATKADIDEVIDTHMVKGQPVSRLMLLPEDKEPEDLQARVA